MQKLIQQPVGFLSVPRIHGVVLVEHGGRFVAGELHDDRGVSPCRLDVDIEGVAEIMESEVFNACLLTSINGSLADPLERLAFIR